MGNTNRKPDDVLKVTVDVDKMHEILDKEKAEREMKESEFIRLLISEKRNNGIPMIPAGSHTALQKLPKCSRTML